MNPIEELKYFYVTYNICNNDFNNYNTIITPV